MNNNILIGHLGWDGCHFLGSCLTMSDKVYFNNFTLRGKIKYFFKKMSSIEKVDEKPVWNDVFMFFGTSYQTDGYVHYRHAWINDPKNNFEQFEIDSRLKQKTSIFRLHVPIYYPLKDILGRNVSHPVSDMFRSKYFICLTNARLFSSLRSVKLENDNRVKGAWDDDCAPIPDVKWFDGSLTEVDRITNSITVSQFQSLPIKIKETIVSYHDSNLEDLFNRTKLHKPDNDLLKSMITHEWNCNWFLSEDETVDQVKFLYYKMNLGKCNEKLIRAMYKIWINKMDYIKKWYMRDVESEYISPINKDMFLK